MTHSIRDPRAANPRLLKVGGTLNEPARESDHKKKSQDVMALKIQGEYPVGWELMSELATELLSRNMEMRAIPGNDQLAFPLNGELGSHEVITLLNIPGNLEICEQALDVGFCLTGRELRLTYTKTKK